MTSKFYTPQSPVTVVEIVRSCAHAFINRARFLNTLPEDFLDPIMLFSWGVRSSDLVRLNEFEDTFWGDNKPFYPPHRSSAAEGVYR
jgi:hypothetical protein